MNNPCFNCQDRVVGCHSTCAAYITYDNWRVDERKKNLDRFNDKVSRASHWDKKWKINSK